MNTILCHPKSEKVRRKKSMQEYLTHKEYYEKYGMINNKKYKYITDLSTK